MSSPSGVQSTSQQNYTPASTTQSSETDFTPSYAELNSDKTEITSVTSSNTSLSTEVTRKFYNFYGYQIVTINFNHYGEFMINYLTKNETDTGFINLVNTMYSNYSEGNFIFNILSYFGIVLIHGNSPDNFRVIIPNGLFTQHEHFIKILQNNGVGQISDSNLLTLQQFATSLRGEKNNLQVVRFLNLVHILLIVVLPLQNQQVVQEYFLKYLAKLTPLLSNDVNYFNKDTYSSFFSVEQSVNGNINENVPVIRRKQKKQPRTGSSIMDIIVVILVIICIIAFYWWVKYIEKMSNKE